MHREHKKLSWFEPCKLKNKEIIFLSLFLLLLFSYLWLVHMCFISLSTFFQPYNYGQLSGNSAFGQVALK